MVFACRVSIYSLALFHLINHAFFKAMLFLRGRLIVHAAIDQQDGRRIGAKWKKWTNLASYLLIGGLNLVRFPFLAGSYSKEKILDRRYSLWMTNSRAASPLGEVRQEFYWSILDSFIALIRVVFTNLYSLRNFRRLFFGEIKDTLFVFKPTVSGMMSTAALASTRPDNRRFVNKIRNRSGPQAAYHKKV